MASSTATLTSLRRSVPISEEFASAPVLTLNFPTRRSGEVVRLAGGKSRQRQEKANERERAIDHLRANFMKRVADQIGRTEQKDTKRQFKRFVQENKRNFF